MKTQPCISPDLYDQTDKVRREAVSFLQETRIRSEPSRPFSSRRTQTARAVELRYGITVSRPPHGHASAAHSLGRPRGEDGLETARARQRGSVTPYMPEGRF